MTVLYVDVSHHDRDRRGAPLDWEQIREQTSPVMVARATYGDPQGFSPSTRYFAEFQRGARSAGYTLRGGYHNLVRGDAASIARQVDWLRSQLDALGCTWAMCDIEPYRELVNNNLWPRWDDVLRWQDRWYAVESRACVWYIPRWFWSEYRKGPNLGSPDLTVLQGPLVQSNYPGGDGTATQIYANAGGDDGTGWDDHYGGRTPDIWQYTSNANVAGASSQTGVNAFRGSLDALGEVLGGDMFTDNDRVMLKRLNWSVGRGAHVPGDAPNIAFTWAWPKLGAQVEALSGVIEQLAETIRNGGGTVDTAAILAGVDERLAAHEQRMSAEVRDAVADLGEGGSTAVRADS